MFVTWAQWGMPAVGTALSRVSPRGSAVDRARIHVGRADRDCAHLGGQETIAAHTASRLARDNWIEMIACLRGPSLATSTAQVEPCSPPPTWVS